MVAVLNTSALVTLLHRTCNDKCNGNAYHAYNENAYSDSAYSAYNENAYSDNAYSDSAYNDKYLQRPKSVVVVMVKISHY